MHYCLHHPEARSPTKTSTGYDLHACRPYFLPSLGSAIVDVGIRFVLPPNLQAIITPRIAITLIGGHAAPFIVDPDDLGTIKIFISNSGISQLVINIGDRVAQVHFQRFEWPYLEEFDLFDRPIAPTPSRRVLFSPLGIDHMFDQFINNLSSDERTNDELIEELENYSETISLIR